MVDNRIRPLALALIRKGDQILVEEGRDDVNEETFWRLLGGAIGFGERGADALRRELREEIGTEAEVKGLRAALENIFTYEGERGHEIVLIYECSLRDDRLYSLEEWETDETTEDGRVTHKLAWRRLDSFRDGGEILYPEGVLSSLAPE